MTKLCYAFLKYENNLKIGWEKDRTVLKCTQMRARVEKGDVLGWNKSIMGGDCLEDGKLINEISSSHWIYLDL